MNDLYQYENRPYDGVLFVPDVHDVGDFVALADVLLAQLVGEGFVLVDVSDQRLEFRRNVRLLPSLRIENVAQFQLPFRVKFLDELARLRLVNEYVK